MTHIDPLPASVPPPQPGLYIVSTPIGNLRDITLRALDILRAADMVLAEDTRQTRKLLNAYGLDTPLIAYHDHNVAKQLPKVLKALGDGKIMAQVSDAGTPLVSDPGYKLVRAAIEAGYNVTAIPGASALLAALVVAGLPSDRFLFAGFLPAKQAARLRALNGLSSITATLVFFESPARIERTLMDMQTALGDRPAALARELTKKFEQTRRGRLSDILTTVHHEPPRGEIVLLVGPPETPSQWDSAQVDAALREAIAQNGVKQAAKDIAEHSGWSKRDVYNRAIQLK